jgi:hypothetical protein
MYNTRGGLFGPKQEDQRSTVTTAVVFPIILLLTMILPFYLKLELSSDPSGVHKPVNHPTVLIMTGWHTTGNCCDPVRNCFVWEDEGDRAS